MQNRFNMKMFIALVVMIFFMYTVVSGQARFQGAGVVGLTASQIDGDDLLGFNKLGISAGIKVKFDLKSRLAGNVELLYSQRGSSTNLITRRDDHSITDLNYFELPAYFSFSDWYIEKEDYYKMSAHLGLSYAALISSSVQNTVYNDADFNQADISYLFGATFRFNQKWALTARYTRAFNKLLKDDTLNNNFLLSYFWTVRMEYYF